jgi:hypothetical protein
LFTYSFHSLDTDYKIFFVTNHRLSCFFVCENKAFLSNNNSTFLTFVCKSVQIYHSKISHDYPTLRMNHFKCVIRKSYAIVQRYVWISSNMSFGKVTRLSQRYIWISSNVSFGKVTRMFQRYVWITSNVSFRMFNDVSTLRMNHFKFVIRTCHVIVFHVTYERVQMYQTEI